MKANVQLYFYLKNVINSYISSKSEVMNAVAKKIISLKQISV